MSVPFWMKPKGLPNCAELVSDHGGNRCHEHAADRKRPNGIESKVLQPIAHVNSLPLFGILSQPLDKVICRAIDLILDIH